MLSMKETKRNSLVTMISTQLVLLLLLFKTTESAKKPIAKKGCPDSCGEIPIPYPFGIGPNCFLSEEFNVTCNITNDGTGTPILSYLGINIMKISLSLGQARVSTIVFSHCYNTTTKKEESVTGIVGFGFGFGDTFWINNEKNKFTVIGCNTFVNLHETKASYSIVGCLSSCDSLDTLNKYGSCSGIGCCQTDIPKDQMHGILPEFDSRYNNSEVYNFSPCSYAMVVEEAEFKFRTTYLTTQELVNQSIPTTYLPIPGLVNQRIPMVLDWAIGNTPCDIALKEKSSYACKSNHSICSNASDHGYLCNCSEGYEGNPYLDGGCQDIDECANQNDCSKLGRKCHNIEGGYRCSCPLAWRSNHNNPRECELNVALVVGIAAGIVALLFLTVGIYAVQERRDLSKVKEKYFQQHGGWVLLEKIKSKQGFGFTIFTKQQVEQATNSFDSENILGHGGQGTVYRGNLRNQIVAIKKCKIVNERKEKEFGKEILILSQINHKNIVKILGCCLEVEVPMLVYEFIPNGTLHHYIHYKKPGSHISLAIRIRIAHESAEALAYLHTSACPPIFHGDVKSANILLDQHYKAKVSDFGASILAPTDDAQFVTLVQGTRGYLDPEYLQSCQLTDKSDVYSFGVVLLELLTSKPVIDFEAPEEEMSLSARFLYAMEQNKMHELIDDEIKHEDDMEFIRAIAKLAKECLRMKGKDRPMMKDVAEELHRINKLKQHPWGQEYHPDDTETLLSERSQHYIEIEHTGYYFNCDQEAEESIQIGR